MLRVSEGYVRDPKLELKTSVLPKTLQARTCPDTVPEKGFLGLKGGNMRLTLPEIFAVKRTKWSVPWFVTVSQR